MKYNIKFTHKASSLSQAINTDIDIDVVSKDMKELLKDGSIQKTEALEKMLIKYDPQTPTDLLAMGIILGGLNGTEMIINHISEAKLPPGLMKEMFNNLVDRAFKNPNLDDLGLGVGLNKEAFEDAMGDDKDEF